ncbi:AsnC family protein [Salinigranum rubrum]|uniref:AsnC family protein n=1 Tax=Salinigranum rubrum TaxID=755307 RepID=A0A2I8VF75_9EURY|nr:AsnC family protein [Salinigranum rubrum]
MEIDGDEWAVEFGFKGCGIASRDDPSFRLDEVREYLVYVYPNAYSSWSDAKKEARKRAYFRISPRWPDIETIEGARSMSNPCDIEGYDIEMEGANWDFEQYPHVLQRALASLADKQGFRFNSPTTIHPKDFDPEATHPTSNIVDAELLVRVVDGKTGKVIAYDGIIHRISLLLSGDREGYAKTVRDDRECPGYYHTATIGSMRASELIGGHRLAKEIKHYHVQSPDAVEGTPLENPKICVSFQNSVHNETLYWDDLDQLERELDETLLNVLEWSDIPTRPDSQFYVADDYFEVEGSSRWRKLLRNRLPMIKEKQDAQVFGIASQMNETDAEIVDTLLTDGGTMSPKDLARAISVSIDTVYRALKRLGPLVEHTYGELQIASKYIAQEMVGYIDSIKDSIHEGLEGALDALFRAETYGERDDPWTRFLDRYGGSIRETEGADPDVLEFGFRPADFREARRLLLEGAARWAEVTGERIRRFGFEFAPVVKLVDGTMYAPKNFADALGKPG